MHHNVIKHTCAHRADVDYTHNDGPPHRLIPPLWPGNDSHTLAQHQASLITIGRTYLDAKSLKLIFQNRKDLALKISNK